ncbi:MAG: hypothetical protein AUK16_03225 [Parcubacteria group bacterium CG2_30_44_11]|nr:MAG: hypothetical protein AUK16_03225 [Parcubacteria group bacterium CG2_30_44_11]
MATLFSVVTVRANAAVITLFSSRDIATYMELTAKLEYLTALLESLQSGGDIVPPPTFAMALRGDVAQINGTIVQPTKIGMMEICSSMTKGTIDWGDGVMESLYGLGCSGDVYTFQRFHQYAEAKSYKITISGGGDTTTKTIAPGEPWTDTSRMLTVRTDDVDVTAFGTITLDAPLKGLCVDSLIGVIDWGDGTSASLMSDGCVVTYQAAHTYAAPGDYKVIVLDLDGDAKQEVVTL